MTRKIELYLDFISPYAYLAWNQIHALAERCDAEVEPRLVLLAAILNHNGQKGPAEIPAKRVHVFHELVRRAGMLGVPFHAPRSHPFNPLTALRAVHAAEPEQRFALIDAFFGVVWGGTSKGGLEDPDIVASAASTTGIDGAALVARTREPDMKALLRSATDAAIERGVFGVPTMTVGDELFWGFSSFDLLEQSLKGVAGPSKDAHAAFVALSPSAKRS